MRWEQCFHDVIESVFQCFAANLVHNRQEIGYGEYSGVSSGRIFRLLFIQYHGICFLNGFIKKTRKAPVNEIRKAVGIKNRLPKYCRATIIWEKIQ